MTTEAHPPNGSNATNGTTQKRRRKAGARAEVDRADLGRQLEEVLSVLRAVKAGDFSARVTIGTREGTIGAIAAELNDVVSLQEAVGSEIIRVAREVGTEGKLGAQAAVEGVSGTWLGLTNNVNVLAGNLTNQVRNIALVTTAVANGDLSQQITVEAKGEILELKDTTNRMVEQLRAFASEVTRVAREVGTEGKLGGQAQVPGAAGTWKD